jgi:uncharacterized protein YciW
MSVTNFDLSAEPSSRVEFAPTSGLADVKLSRPYGQAYLAPTYLVPTMSEAAVQEQSKRANARLALALTVACIVLVMFDLFLLASGS